MMVVQLAFLLMPINFLRNSTLVEIVDIIYCVIKKEKIIEFKDRTCNELWK